MVNLVRDSNDVLKLAFDSMEGRGFFDRSATAQPSMYNIAGCLQWLVEEPNEESAFEIYGSGGLHRYWIDRFGNISYSQMHGKENATQAAAMGFTIR